MCSVKAAIHSSVKSLPLGIVAMGEALAVLLLMVQLAPLTTTATVKELSCNSTILDAIPEWNNMKGPWSCEHRCGESYSQDPCACDDLCEMNEDCCEDFAAYCPLPNLTKRVSTQPPASNTQPPTTVSNTQPPTTVSNTQPTTTVRNTQPPTTVSNTQPPTTVSNTQPPTTVSNTQPTTTVRNTQPPTTVSNTQPPTTVSNTQPPTTLSNTQPPTTVSNTQPPTTVSNTQPPTTVSNTQPPTTVSNTQPPTTVSSLPGLQSSRFRLPSRSRGKLISPSADGGNDGESSEAQPQDFTVSENVTQVKSRNNEPSEKAQPQDLTVSKNMTQVKSRNNEPSEKAQPQDLTVSKNMTQVKSRNNEPSEKAQPQDLTVSENVSQGLLSPSSLLGKVECRHRTKLVAECPQPPVPLPASPLFYRGQLIQPEEVVPRCNTPLEVSEDEDVLQAIPVTDAPSGIHLANVYCLLCHGGRLEDAQPWALDWVWNYRALSNLEPSVTSIQDLLLLAKQMGAKSLALPPPGIIPRRCLHNDDSFENYCRCPSLTAPCGQGQDSYITAGKLNFRNPHCALCYFLSTDKHLDPKIIMKPDLEVLARTLGKNNLEFSTTMKWTSDPLDGLSASLQIYSDAESKISFDFVEMVCNVSRLEPDHIITRRAVALRTRKMDFDDQREHANTTDEAVEKQLKRGKLKMTTAMTTTETGQVVRGVNPDNIESGAQMGPKTSGIMNSDCRKERCSINAPRLNGECRHDLFRSTFNVLVTCDLRDITTNDMMPSHAVHSLTPHTLSRLQDSLTRAITLRQQLQPSPKHQNEDAFLTGLAGTRYQDNCFWNVTASFLSNPQEITSRELYVIILNALEEAVDGPLGPPGTQLHVCCGIRLNIEPDSPWLGSVCIFSETVFSAHLEDASVFRSMGVSPAGASGDLWLVTTAAVALPGLLSFLGSY